MPRSRTERGTLWFLACLILWWPLNQVMDKVRFACCEFECHSTILLYNHEIGTIVSRERGWTTAPSDEPSSSVLDEVTTTVSATGSTTRLKWEQTSTLWTIDLPAAPSRSHPGPILADIAQLLEPLDATPADIDSFFRLLSNVVRLNQPLYLWHHLGRQSISRHLHSIAPRLSTTLVAEFRLANYSGFCTLTLFAILLPFILQTQALDVTRIRSQGITPRIQVRRPG